MPDSARYASRHVPISSRWALPPLRQPRKSRHVPKCSRSVPPPPPGESPGSLVKASPGTSATTAAFPVLVPPAMLSFLLTSHVILGEAKNLPVTTAMKVASGCRRGKETDISPEIAVTTAMKRLYGCRRDIVGCPEPVEGRSEESASRLRRQRPEGEESLQSSPQPDVAAAAGPRTRSAAVPGRPPGRLSSTKALVSWLKTTC